MPLNNFFIEKNNFLNKRIKSYYRCNYIGYTREGNPDYINHLKNTFRSFGDKKLYEASSKLAAGLDDELIEILEDSDFKQSVVVCTVPRSKSLSYYNNNQLLFSATIRNVVRDLINRGFRIIEGTTYIERHKNTKTTHLMHSERAIEYAGDGLMPCPGITKNTCYLNENLKGKPVLLIDDVYTQNVNVDEDCIQALIDFGASDVIFFSIAKA